MEKPAIPDQLTAAMAAVQKLEKKFRQLVNQGTLTAADLEDARAARACLARIYARHGWHAFDLDSRAEKERRRRN